MVEPIMSVDVRVGFAAEIIWTVIVLVMDIMNMTVRMRDWLMHMPMPVPFGKMNVGTSPRCGRRACRARRALRGHADGQRRAYALFPRVRPPWKNDRGARDGRNDLELFACGAIGANDAPA
jgi:hypothetical protein